MLAILKTREMSAVFHLEFDWFGLFKTYLMYWQPEIAGWHLWWLFEFISLLEDPFFHFEHSDERIHISEQVKLGHLFNCGLPGGIF